MNSESALLEMLDPFPVDPVGSTDLIVDFSADYLSIAEKDFLMSMGEEVADVELDL